MNVIPRLRVTDVLIKIALVLCARSGISFALCIISQTTKGSLSKQFIL